jgi:tRNA wybutosine-synthesizing protein 4
MVNPPLSPDNGVTLTHPAEFVLLEQILPDGEHHPFASTMLNHFNKLNTQLKSVSTYPTVSDQFTRFSSRGWESVKVWTLWEAWADETFLSASERRALDDIEQFDEWEEFALFASHYCVVHARAGTNCAAIPPPFVPPPGGGFFLEPVALQYDECQGVRGQRRFAAAMHLNEPWTQESVLNVLGLGTKSRLQSCDVFSLGDPETEGSITFREGGPTTRMCHSLTDLGNGRVLLTGGRGSPSSPLKDCWLFDKLAKVWVQMHDLPTPLYRHSVTALGWSGLVLLLGGRGEKEPFDGCLVYHPLRGWIDCEILGDKPAAVYGAALCCFESESGAAVFKGIYSGGMENGLISNQLLTWEADVSDIKVCCFCLLSTS